MKIALYIEDGLEQIVLTPETETEKRLLALLHADTRDISILTAQLYIGRDSALHIANPGYSSVKDSTFIIMRPKPPEPPRPEWPKQLWSTDGNVVGLAPDQQSYDWMLANGWQTA